MPQTQQTSSLALVIGAGGSIGAALLDHLHRQSPDWRVVGTTRPQLDICDEAAIITFARSLAQDHPVLPLRRLFIATGVLARQGLRPEKALAALDPAQMRQSFAVNALGPALLLKHLLPLLPRQGRSEVAVLSARVGSIGDNQLGGWYSYRAAKAALNQIVHSAAIELQRRCPDAVCVALHPGTVAGPFTDGFQKSGLTVRQPAQAAAQLCQVLAGLSPAQSGGFFDYAGEPIPW